MFMIIDCVFVCIDVEVGRYIFVGRCMEDREFIVMVVVLGVVNFIMKLFFCVFKDRVKVLYYW